MLLLAALLPVVIRDVVTVGAVGRGGRIPFPTDLVASAVASDSFVAPVTGSKVGEQTWTAKAANADGWFEGLRGYSFATVDWPTAGVAVLHATGHGMVYVNGEPRMGDPYGFGYGRLPVYLKKGRNEFLFANGRGRLNAELIPVSKSAAWNPADITTPDLLADGVSREYYVGLIALNQENARVSDLRWEVSLAGKVVSSGEIGAMCALEARKVPISFKAAASSGEKTDLVITIRKGSSSLDSATVSIRHRTPHETRKNTFISDIDGSVQYYGVVPPTDLKANAMVLTVHGASVEGLGQAEAYSPKPWCWIVAPTNRRPYGFDWEEWGRMDALEVLEDAAKRFKIDRSRISVTGHSMGGHGAWHLGAHFPQVFNAIAPSAGWRSFFTYGGKPKETGDALVDLVNRASNPSLTDLLFENYRNKPIYVLHGDADDNVPVSEARGMRDDLAKMGINVGYFEQPGAGHWWDGDKSPGADCVDWPPIFEMFGKAKNEGSYSWSFTTLNPAISAGPEGFKILAQENRMKPSKITVRGSQITTENVFAMEVPDGFKVVDGFITTVTGGGDIGNLAKMVDTVLLKSQGQWQLALRKDVLATNGSQRGPIKEVMRNNMVFIYDTKGTAEENAWMLAKARYDAEQFWYRGNGGVKVLSAVDVIRNGEKGTWVLYGNAKINRLWSTKAPIKLEPNQIKTTEKTLEGSFGSIFWFDDRGRSIVCVGGTDLAAMRATERLPLFVSGVGYPDWVVFKPSVVAEGYPGVLGAGYWGIGSNPGESTWR